MAEHKHDKEKPAPAAPLRKTLKVAKSGSRISLFADNPEIFPLGAYDSFVGELLPGEHGWLPLGPDGTPSGPATLEAPDAGTPACRVFANGSTSLNVDLLVSAAGAPLVPPLNPNSDVRMVGEAAPPLPLEARTKAAEREKVASTRA
jgi:hypothetical protein